MASFASHHPRSCQESKTTSIWHDICMCVYTSKYEIPSFFSFFPQLIQYATEESDRNVCMSRGYTQTLCSRSTRKRDFHHIVPDRVKSPKQHPYGMCVYISKYKVPFFSYFPQLIQYGTVESDYYRNVCMSRGCTQASCSRSTRKRDG